MLARCLPTLGVAFPLACSCVPIHYLTTLPQEAGGELATDTAVRWPFSWGLAASHMPDTNMQ